MRIRIDRDWYLLASAELAATLSSLARRLRPLEYPRLILRQSHIGQVRL
jgi:hypothetical protein